MRTQKIATVTYLRELLRQLLCKLDSLVLHLQSTEINDIGANVAACRGAISIRDLPGSTVDFLESARLGGIERSLLVLSVGRTQNILR
jgi:hypothetical protein